MIQDTVKSYMLNPALGSMLRELAGVEGIRGLARSGTHQSAQASHHLADRALGGGVGDDSAATDLTAYPIRC